MSQFPLCPTQIQYSLAWNGSHMTVRCKPCVRLGYIKLGSVKQGKDRLGMWHIQGRDETQALRGETRK